MEDVKKKEQRERVSNSRDENETHRTEEKYEVRNRMNVYKRA